MPHHLQDEKKVEGQEKFEEEVQKDKAEIEVEWTSGVASLGYQLMVFVILFFKNVCDIFKM